MDNLHNKLIFDLVKKTNPGKNLFKVVKFQICWLKNVVMCGKYSLTKFANFLIVLRVHIR